MNVVDRLRSRSGLLLSDEKTKTLRRRGLRCSGTKDIVNSNGSVPLHDRLRSRSALLVSNGKAKTRSTMNDYVDAEHIREMILDGTVQMLPATVSMQAEEFLKRRFPLHTKTSTWIIDWDVTPFLSLQWSDATDDEAVAWAAKTSASCSTFGLLLFNSDQPCLLGEFSFMIRHFDELVWAAAGNRLLFGVERGDDERVVFDKGVIEFNGKGELRGSL